MNRHRFSRSPFGRCCRTTTSCFSGEHALLDEPLHMLSKEDKVCDVVEEARGDNLGQPFNVLINPAGIERR
jgi:hypothetical protein